MSASTHSSIANPSTFAGRTVIVSGCAGKLGRVISIALAAAGANLVLNDVKAEPLKELTQSLEGKGGGNTISVLTTGADGDTVAAQAIDRFGRIDAIITPTLGPIPWNPLEDLNDDVFRAAFEANTLTPLSLVRAAWPHFKKQQYGRVVNFTSDSMLGFPTASAYTMTKGALFGVNKTLAMEGASHGIKVNCVSPIAYVPQMERHIMRFSDVQRAFKEYYFPEANVPMILALASGGCTATGEVFNTAGWAVGRNVWGVSKGINGLKTMEDCVNHIEVLTEKGPNVFEPTSMVDFTEFQSAYVLGNEEKS